jgi:signal transduction histidine kinase
MTPIYHRRIEYVSSVLVLVFLLLYSYAYLFLVPYFGFFYNAADGEIIEIWVDQPAFRTLQPGDHLLQIGSLTWTDFISDNRQSFLQGKQSGDVIEIIIERNDQKVTIPWTLPGPNLVESIDRLSALWLWLMFWLAGTATILLVRPRSKTRALIIAFYYLFAPWLLAGWMSSSGIWDTRILARALAWIIAVMYLHLNWVIPRPLGRIPTGLLWAAYLVTGVLGVLELFQLMPQNAYAVGIMFALAGSIIILILHAVLQPDTRKDLKVLAVALLMAGGAGILLSSQTTSLININIWLVWIAFLSLTAIPGAYFYVIYRRQLGGLELRANRIISLYLYTVLLLMLLTILFWFTNTSIADRNFEIAAEISGLFIAGLLTAIAYPGFQRLIERRILGIPLPPAHLIEAYASKITTSLDSENLVVILRDEIQRSLLIRQSALLGVNEGDTITLLYSTEVAKSEIPTPADIPILLEQSGKYQLPASNHGKTNPFKWVRLVLPLEAGGKLIGIWLLGKRDPDNFYAQSEITVLQTIANQTAIALINIAHTRLLHALYQADIERQEKERAALARGLHDEVLNQLATFFMQQPAFGGTDAYGESKELITNYLREVISDLRPPMLNYGLQPAIYELVDNLMQRTNENPSIEISLNSSGTRYDPHIEQHVFRIVQQASENAVRHAHALNIQISGDLNPESIHLVVFDDGLGFPTANSQDFEQLLSQEHYGLVGMYERASIIGADLKISSQRGWGTRVELVWPEDSQ